MDYKYQKEGAGVINNDTPEYHNALLRRQRIKNEKKRDKLILELMERVEKLEQIIEEMANVGK